MKKVLVVILALFFVGCVNTQTPFVPLQESSFKIIKTSQNDEISYEKLISELLEADIILLGERHGNPNHKITEVMIFESLKEGFQKKGKRLDVGFEMIASVEQEKLDKAKSKKENISSSNLRSALNWDKSWKWEDYEKLVNSVFYSQSRLLGANISREEVSTIFGGVQPLKGFASTKKEVKDTLLKIIAASHEVDVSVDENKKMLSQFVEVQQYKDRRMADILVHNNFPILLVAGNVHVSKELGVPLHIQDFKSPKKVLVVSMSVSKDDVKKDEADYIFYYNNSQIENSKTKDKK